MVQALGGAAVPVLAGDAVRAVLVGDADLGAASASVGVTAGGARPFPRNGKSLNMRRKIWKKN